ncbi:MAG TPA: Holliday junction branch migration protein RuvA [Candidatus Scubalenecus merdavium]|uniref:Holliday junction branch migration complex subunit RuvA n=1 Tax=Candidatus Scybalenecus merdavium TaxID=2840939 RepID=A0A9D1MTT4_9FIRM|nr:Holliday junction branch migration protein RuvA [Candidatus Scubalenecus merdavium]
MFYSLRGKLAFTDPAFVVLDCGGVCFKCFTSLNTIRSLPSAGSEVTLFTHMLVKEDALDLYGFFTTQELECFRLLISVSGIGPKAAVSILSELTPDKLAISIASGDAKALTRAQGVGKKIAERAVLELKSKITGVAASAADVSAAASVSADAGSDAAEAVEALVALGYGRSDAAVAVGSMDKSLSVDEMIRQGLKMLAASL